MNMKNDKKNEIKILANPGLAWGITDLSPGSTFTYFYLLPTFTYFQSYCSFVFLIFCANIFFFKVFG